MKLFVVTCVALSTSLVHGLSVATPTQGKGAQYSAANLPNPAGGTAQQPNAIVKQQAPDFKSKAYGSMLSAIYESDRVPLTPESTYPNHHAQADQNGKKLIPLGSVNGPKTVSMIEAIYESDYVPLSPETIYPNHVPQAANNGKRLIPHNRLEDTRPRTLSHQETRILETEYVPIRP